MNKDRIDYPKLREELYNNSMGAAFCGGYGGAFFEASEIKKAGNEQLVAIAQSNGVNLNNFIKHN